MEENMISNEFSVKLCLEHEVKHGYKVVKKELIVALRGEIYFVMFIINPEKDDVEPRVVLGRSFMRLTKRISNFRNETITIYPKPDTFLDSSGEEEKIGDNWDLLLDDLDFGDIPDIEGEEAEREALAIDICRRYSLLEEERPVIKTKANSDQYKKILDGICLDKMKLDGEIKKEEEEAITRIKGEALIEKEDPGAFVILIRLEGTRQRGGNGCKKRNNNVEPLKGRACEASEGYPVPAKTILDTVVSDSGDEEEYVIQRNKFRALIYGPKPAQYLNCNDPMDRSLALQAVLNPFRKTIGTHDDDARSTRFKRSRQYETVEEVMLPHVHHMFLLWEGCNQAANSRYNTKLAQLLPRLIYSPCVVDWNVLNQMSYGEAIDEMLMIKLFVASTTKEIFTSQAWTNAFNIDEPIYSELCHEFYSTYEFDKVCAADELRTKKIIKFRLFGSRHQNGYVNVAWLIARWMKMKGAGSQKESMICCGQCITKISKRKNLLSKEGRLIPEAPEPGVPRVVILRPREHQCRICMRGYVGVFEHMARVYSVPLSGAYNAPGYDQQQYDQYYQQYPPQQQPDDDE
ncbi:hypothetical protein Tco_0825060 [Tanacetum coccineum]